MLFHHWPFVKVLFFLAKSSSSTTRITSLHIKAYWLRMSTFRHDLGTSLQYWILVGTRTWTLVWAQHPRALMLMIKGLACSRLLKQIVTLLPLHDRWNLGMSQLLQAGILSISQVLIRKEMCLWSTKHVKLTIWGKKPTSTDSRLDQGQD